MTTVTLYRAILPNGYIEASTEAEARKHSHQVEIIERVIEEPMPITPEPSPIEIRLAALEAKTGVTEADKLAARETIITKRRPTT